MELHEILKGLADANRLRILNLLRDRTLCVCDIEAILKLNQSNLSRHLARLKQSGLVVAEKRGLYTYYSIDTGTSRYGTVLERLFAEMADDPTWRSDREELAARLATCC